MAKTNRVLQVARAKQDISRQVVADKLGVHLSTIVDWETGKKHPKLIRLPQVCEVYKINMYELLHHFDLIKEHELRPELKE